MKYHHMPPERFWSKVDIRGPNECWNWTGCKLKRGYGAAAYLGHQMSSSRAAYLIHHGLERLEWAQCVCHSCDNTACCNPAHLWLGDRRSNFMDAKRKQRITQGYKAGSRHWGAKMTEANVIEARAMRAVGHTVESIAQKFGVTGSTMSVALRGLKWAHVKESA